MPAVKAGAVATPRALVVAVIVLPPAKLPPAPVAGAAKVTVDAADRVAVLVIDRRLERGGEGGADHGGSAACRRWP